MELIEGEANLKKKDRDLEDIGVRLYSLQLRLAENQMILEQSFDNFNIVKKLRWEVVYVVYWPARVDSEEKSKVVHGNFLVKSKEGEELSKKQVKL